MAELKSQVHNIRSLKADELELWLQFLADAFGNKHPNMLELFRMLINKDKHFHVEDILLLGQRFAIALYFNTCIHTPLLQYRE